MSEQLQRARAVADAVLYEGYLLYPYRATSDKNRSRWQFGVLGPPGAAAAGTGEDARMATELLVRPTGSDTTVTVRLRFLQVQRRTARTVTAAGEEVETGELVVGDRRWLAWDEAVEREPHPLTWSLSALADGQAIDLRVAGGADVEDVTGPDGLPAGRLVRTRTQLEATLRARSDAVGDPDVHRVSIGVENVTDGGIGDTATAIASSFIGAHLLVSVEHGEFMSLTDPPHALAGAAAACDQHRCWPVLGGAPGDASLMLVSPIILPDHPEVAEQSAGALFDATEIDEILTLRVMTMTDEEKAAARATDAKAAEIVDRCEAMSPDAMAQLHGVLRNPGAASGYADDPFLPGPPDAFGNDLSGTFGFDGEVPWWDPAVDGNVDPLTDSVVVRGVEVTAGSVVRIRPNRRADAQDIFFADQLARVTAVHTDVDGGTHVAVVLLGDPAAEMHDWYGRYLHFAPDEIEPEPAAPPAGEDNRQESRP